MKNNNSIRTASSLPSFGGAGGGRIVVIDNYDSFTYNLVHAIKKISGLPVDVFRNDEIALEDLEKYDKIVLSPGPGIPEEAGLLLKIIKEYAPKKSMLGVCLGHQAIGEAFGGKLHNMSRVLHGIATPVELTEIKSVLFDGLPKTLEVGRYHSWIVQQEELPDCLEVTSYDNDGFIMSMKHKEYDVQGVQFHPESVLTPLGEKMIENWLNS
ncbi:aminodeoxychorismate/anthranilate synthase component II [Maribellus comscasis]|uniref:Aminodeoxychorismate/anthranilate synthase component II n=1 Tax=Maribellus comscasis TaxID=2681766 RepID=A0A6I6JSQ1_9BACT|nr:aminodeoxychorismate/anthranilate synthase component II [Maribellus comscasis]QGY44108.1 aminodeoxychorismate/anthranilate synthase component II [Maribellus comscasis]